MKKPLHFSIKISAPLTVVWQKMFDLEPYEMWTTVFAPGSTYEGSWEQGAKIKFLDGKGSGMVSMIAENKPHKFVSIKHLGYIIDDKEDTESPEVKAWAPSYENYSFTQIAGGTQIDVDMEITENYEEMMNKMWPQALSALKELAEAEPMEFAEPISIEAEIKAPVSKVWEYWNNPEHIKNWCFASDDWHAPNSQNDLKIGGHFSTTMAAKDGSMSFDFAGLYTEVSPHELIEYELGDGRKVKIAFAEKDGLTKVTEVFDPEKLNPREMQQDGWQAILNNFKKYVESTTTN